MKEYWFDKEEIIKYSTNRDVSKELSGEDGEDRERSVTNSKMHAGPDGDFNYDLMVGSGHTMYHLVDWQWAIIHDSRFYSHANSAIAEAKYAKETGVQFWTIAMTNDKKGQDILKRLAVEKYEDDPKKKPVEKPSNESPKNYYQYDPNTFDSENLNEFLNTILDEIQIKLKGPIVTVKLGEEFSFHQPDSKITCTKGIVQHTPNEITWDLDKTNSTNSLKKRSNDTTSNDPLDEYPELTYQVEMKPDKSYVKTENVYPINESIVLEYDVGKEQTKKIKFPTQKELKVKPTLYKIVTVLQDENGKNIKEDHDFEFKLKGPEISKKFPLNTKENNETNWLTDLRWQGDYSFEEVLSSEDKASYDIEYYVNDNKVEPTELEGSDKKVPKFHVDENSGTIVLKVVNKEKPTEEEYYELPSTGGIGTQAIALGASFIMTLSAYFFIKNKRKGEGEN